MNLNGLALDTVARVTDVSDARERARLRRLRRLGLLGALVAVVAGGVVLLGHLPFHFPSGWGVYVPSMVLILALVAAITAPMIAAARSPHVQYRPEEIGITLADVVGAGTVVDEVVKTLNLFLSHRTFRTEMGGSARRGLLFEGPPGTGKTYIAKAMAAEAGVPFLFVSSSAFQSPYYGMTNRKIRSYFKALRRAARREGGAIGFIEEIDAIGASRSGMGGSGGREGFAGVVNELLIQLQSFDQPSLSDRVRGLGVDMVNRLLPAAHRRRKRLPEPANILVIGATNRADDLDPALVRPGRFDRTISVDLPSRSGRREILDYYLDRKAHDADLDDPVRRDALAALTFGYSPVMLEKLLDEALVWALRRGAAALDWEDLQRAKMTTELGVTQPAALVDGERQTVAVHEAGHATVAWLLAPERRLEVLSIIKRRSSLGLLAHSETEERWTRTRSEMDNLLRIAMGGLVAEELFVGQTSSGVAGDLQAATQTAAQMVGSFGMAGSLISLEAVDGPGRGNLVAKVLADDATKAAVEQILDEARADVRTLLAERRYLVAALRDALVERDELIGAEIDDVLRAADLAHRSATLDLRDGHEAGATGDRG